jgi:hypothetical protein
MSNAAVAVFGAIGGALVTGACSILIFLVRRRTTLHNDHLQRAFVKHLDLYEQVFVSARTAQDSLRNYRLISGRVDDRSDPFLFQLLAIATDSAREYCVSVTWNHNPGMLYLDRKLEENCLNVRDLLLRWLAVRRVHWGEVASIRKNEEYLSIPPERVTGLKLGDYRELRLETRRIVLKDVDDARRLKEIDRALTVVIADLKTVMAY